MMSCTVKYSWVCLESSPGVSYVFPGKVTSQIKRYLARPGVYRWAIFENCGEPVAVYVGESESMLRRWSEYRSPTTKEEQGWNHYFLQEIEKGRKVEFQVLDFQAFEINGVAFSIESLIDPFHRKLMENLMLANLQAQGYVILNKKSDLKAKEVKRVMKQLQKLKLTEEQLIAALKRVQDKGHTDGCHPERSGGPAGRDRRGVEGPAFE